MTVEGLLGQSQALEELAQRRDDTPADFDAAGNAENQGLLAIRVLTLPKVAQALEDAATAVSTACSALRTAATNLDRLNKLFYAALKAEA